MQQRPWGFTLAHWVALSERLRSLLFSASPCFFSAAWSVCSLQAGGFGCRIIEEKTPTAGHRWGCGGTGPDDQDRFNVVWAAAWCIHVVPFRAIFTEWLYGSDLGSSGCSDRIHCKYKVISCMWWTVDSAGPSWSCIFERPCPHFALTRRERKHIMAAKAQKKRK